MSESTQNHASLLSEGAVPAGVRQFSGRRTASLLKHFAVYCVSPATRTDQAGFEADEGNTVTRAPDAEAVNFFLSLPSLMARACSGESLLPECANLILSRLSALAFFPVLAARNFSENSADIFLPRFAARSFALCSSLKCFPNSGFFSPTLDAVILALCSSESDLPLKAAPIAARASSV